MSENNTKVEILRHHIGQDGDGEFSCLIPNISLRTQPEPGLGVISSGTVDVLGCSRDSQADATANAATLLRVLAYELGVVAAKLTATAESLAPIGVVVPATAATYPDLVTAGAEPVRELAQSIAAARATREQQMQRHADSIRAWAGSEIVKASGAGMTKLMLALPGSDAFDVVAEMLERNRVRYRDVGGVEAIPGVPGVGFPVFAGGPQSPLNSRRMVVDIDSIPAATGASA